MTFKAVGANNPFIKNLNSIKYVVEADGTTTLVVNQTQLVGRYPTLANAQDAAAGILIKLGNKDPTTRLSQIFTQTINLDNGGGNILPPAGDDYSLDAVTLLPVRHYRTITDGGGGTTITENTYQSSMIRATGITVPVNIRYQASRIPCNMYYLKTTTPSVSSSGLPPEFSSGFVQWFSGDTVTVNPNDYLRLKASVVVNGSFEFSSQLEKSFSLYNDSENGQLWTSGIFEYIYTDNTAT